MRRRVQRINPFYDVAQWPTQPEDESPEGEFLDRYRDTSRVGNITPREWQRIQAKTGSAGARPGGIVGNVPVGVGPATPVIRQARFVNLAATVGTTAVQLLASNARRTYLIIQNTSAATIFVTFDRPASLASGIQIVAAGNYEPLTPPVSSVWAISLVANLTTVLVEGTT